MLCYLMFTVVANASAAAPTVVVANAPAPAKPCHYYQAPAAATAKLLPLLPSPYSCHCLAAKTLNICIIVVFITLEY